MNFLQNGGGPKIERPFYSADAQTWQ